MLVHAPANRGAWQGQNLLQRATQTCEPPGQASLEQTLAGPATGQKVRPPKLAQNRWCRLNHRRNKSTGHKCQVAEMTEHCESDASYHIMLGPPDPERSN